MTTASHTSLSSLDDIVFEGRNKAYGAYVLRQTYGQHVRKASIIGGSLALLLLAVPMVVQRVWPTPPPVADIPLPTPVIEFINDPTVQPTSPPPAAVQPTVVVTPPRTFPTRVVPDDQVKPTQPDEITAPDVEGPVVVGPVAQPGSGAVPGTIGGTGNDTSAKPAAPAVVEPFIHVEEMPEFAGGQAALTKYLQRNLRYPSQALREGVSGKVFISFTVNADGSIQDVSVLKGLGYGTDEEASRVIRQMPAWKPGFQNHHAVPVRYTLPITFKYE